MSDNIARGLDDLMRRAQESFEADSAQAPDEVVASVRSRHRRSGGVLAGVAVVACVAIGAGGIGLTGANGGDPAPSFTASPSPVPSEDLTVPLATATIPIEGGPAYDGVESLLECGAPAPEPTDTVDHFAVSIAEPSPLTIPADVASSGAADFVNTVITYDGTESVPVAQTPVTLVLIKDGKVAGHFRPDDTALRYWTYNNFDGSYGGSGLMPLGSFCPEVSEPVSDEQAQYWGEYTVLSPGEYQVVPVARVWANEEAAALRLLYQGGINVANSAFSRDSAEYLPGSWDCKQAVASGWSPRVCLGDATGAAIVDMAAGTVTLPYEVDQLTTSLDLTLVGDPVALSVPGPFEIPEFETYNSKPLDVSGPLECGVTFDYTTPEAPVLVSGKMPRTLGLGAGAFNSTNAALLPVGSGAGELRIEPGAKAWLVAGLTEDYNYFRSHPGNQQIVGFADVSITGGNTVQYDRYAGPTMVDLVFTGVTLCDGFTLDSGIDAAVIDADLTMTPEGADRKDPTRRLLEFSPLLDF
ncbi:hypothetical protein [Demequina aurantiaca]|uniref:hypothetical protein n=1 Tax=Demequina aurantiaca TaxID=676200 RepID=UPI003D32FF43